MKKSMICVMSLFFLIFAGTTQGQETCIGEYCGECSGSFCQSGGTNVCPCSDIELPCKGTGIGMYCSKSCASDEDCVNPNTSMKCLTNCFDRPEIEGTCWEETSAEWMASVVCGCAPDGYEPDNDSSQATLVTPGVPQEHSICPAGDEDWITFVLLEESEVIIELSGVAGDTEMWLYDGAFNAIEYNDDGGNDQFSNIDRTCNVDTLPAGIYYVKINEGGNDDEIGIYRVTLTVATECPECVMFESFENGIVPPAGWTHLITNPGFTWKIDNTNPHTGMYLSSVEYDPALVPQDEVLISPAGDYTSIVFWMLGSYYWGVSPNNNYNVSLWIVKGNWDGGTVDDVLMTADVMEDCMQSTSDSFVWKKCSYDLLPVSSGDRIAFRYAGADGAQFGLDDICIMGDVGCSCDVNGNGAITPEDALCAFQKYLGICPTVCGSCEEVCCDVSDDGTCTPADALCVFQDYLGIGCEHCS